jgi:multiple sugar transport system ATP-binding protein
MAKLTIKSLKKSFGRNTVINNVSFDVPEGEFCILLGPSGCGKTTVLRLIAGLEQQDNGQIFIDEREVSSLTPRQRDVAMVFQSYALYPHLNVYENMAFSLRMQKKPKNEVEEKVREVARLLDLEHYLKRKPRELSGGQRQRVAIGRTIVRNPKLFLFDEPLSNLDAKLRASMRVELAKLHQALGATMIYVTHDQIEAMTLGEKVILFNEGIIQQIGTPREVYELPANLFVATFIGSPGINLLEGSIVSHENALCFRSKEFIIDVGKREELQKYTGEEVTLGIRPESLTPGEGPIYGNIEIIEHIGPETIIYLKAADTRLIAKAPSGFSAETGAKISLALSTRGIHFFHKRTRIKLG